MIITREWLNEWIDIKEIETDDIAKELNSIGLEVDSVTKIRMPKDVVVGLVISCEKHPNADKLNVCKVDVGGKIEQIVCGAKNVTNGLKVAVAKVGSTLPGNFKIKPAKLRGVESNGMICSSSELGLPEINDGIMILDDSIGELKLGKQLGDFSLLNDDVVELELTANRGDCLSIHGVARDLCVPFGLEIKQIDVKEDDDNQLGIGRVLNVTVGEKIESSFIFKAFNSTDIKSNLLIDLRLALVGESCDDALQRLITYSTYNTGVLLRAYKYDAFDHRNDKALVSLKKQKNSLDAVLGRDIVSYVGVYQEEFSKANSDTKKVIIEANYCDPSIISENTYNKKIKSDRHLYRSSRGSEPNLDFGMNYLVNLLRDSEDTMIYAGSQEVIQDFYEIVINLHLDDLNKMVGEEISKNRVVKILKSLGFDVVFNHEQESLRIKVPQFRHDITNKQDICEEIVRMVGIDNIGAKPLLFYQSAKHNRSYQNFKKRQMYRCRASQSGYFETLHFIFDDKERNRKYGLESVRDDIDVLNPITSELNSLRTSLIPNMLDSVSKNVNYGRKSIPLFEIGTVFDKERRESVNMAFIYSGDRDYASILNHGKPKEIDFFTFARDISNTIGVFELFEGEPKIEICNPYEYAILKRDGVELGYMARLHSNIQNDFNIPKTYICELSFDRLPFQKSIVKPYSSFQAISRDLSLLIPADLSYQKINSFLNTLDIANLISFSAVDVYKNRDFGDMVSLTIKFNFQADDRTLKDDDISDAMNTILSSVKKEFGIDIR